MNYASIAHVLGLLLIVTGSSISLPAVCSLLYGGDDFLALFISACLILGVGVPLRFFFRRYDDLNIREGLFLLP